MWTLQVTKEVVVMKNMKQHTLAVAVTMAVMSLGISPVAQAITPSWTYISPATSPIDATTAHHADRHQGGDRLASLVGEHRALRDLVSRLASGREPVANAAARRGSRARQLHGSRVSASQWRGRTAPK